MRRGNLVKRVLAGVLIGTMTLGLAGCGTGQQEDAGSGSVQDAAQNKEDAGDDKGDLKELRIGVGGSDNAMTMEMGNLAYQKGYLEEELNAVGYTAKITAFMGAGPEINEALASGELDAAIYGDFPAFTSKSNGIDTRIVASVNSKQQYALLSGNDKVTKPKDLEGHKVIVPQGSITQFFWENYAEARGIDTDKVEIINAASDATSLLQSGDADAYIMTANIQYYMESLGVGKVIDTGSDVEEASPTYIFNMTNKVLEETPELGVAVNKALIRAYEDAVKDPEALYEAVSSESLPPEFARKSYEFDTSLKYMSPEITEEKLSYYEGLVDWMIDHSVISEKVDVKSFVDTSYYAKAAEELK